MRFPQVSPYLNNVILSPHIYPPSVTNAPSNWSGDGLNYRLSRSFGSKMKSVSNPWHREGHSCVVQHARHNVGPMSRAHTLHRRLVNKHMMLTTWATAEVSEVLAIGLCRHLCCCRRGTRSKG